MPALIRACCLLTMVALSSPALAQDAPAPCHGISPTDRVVVRTTDGASLRGTLMCVTATDALLWREGRLEMTPLAEVTRIETRADPVWDGALMGAVVPLIIWAVFCHECDPEPMLRGAAGYGLIGLAWDSLQRNTRTLYAGTGGASVQWRIRF